MITDSSIWLHHKYFGLKNPQIIIKLKNGRVLKGIIHGYYHGDEDKGEPRYWMWHILDPNEAYTLGVDAFGFQMGEIIRHREIAEVYFEEDHTKMKF